MGNKDLLDVLLLKVSDSAAVSKAVSKSSPTESSAP